MTLKTPRSVRIERPVNTYGTAMNEIRTWLDTHKIQPAEFRPDASGPDAVAFEIRFQREDEAQLFEQAFA
jgi:hypothetical protein